MIRFQIRKTKLPTRAAPGRRGRINTAALVASVTLIAQILSACAVPLQSFSATGGAAPYPDLNDPTPRAAAVRADELTQLKAELIRIPDDHERAAARQQRSVGLVSTAPNFGVEPAVFFATAP
jgi:hypothetical protein